MITDIKTWHYLALKNELTFDGEKWRSHAVTCLSRLLRGTTSNHHGDFYCLNCYHSYNAEDTKYKVLKEIPVVIHNVGYDTHFVIKQLAEKLGDQFECIGEKAEKYINFSAPIKKEPDNRKTITHKLKFINNFRLMPASLSSLVDNLSEIQIKKM